MEQIVMPILYALIIYFGAIYLIPLAIAIIAIIIAVIRAIYIYFKNR